ncbi:MAG: GatB/YqeY domain-containing protein [Bdellovibrionota bacterium]
MSVKEQIKNAMTAAMKSKEAERLQAIRNIWGALRKKEIDDRKDLTDAEVQKLVMNLTKQLQETIAQAKTTGRDDLADESLKELAVLKEFLPEMMTAEELIKVVTTLHADLKAAGTLPEGNAAMGILMKKTMEAVGSRAEGKAVQEAVRKVLT